MSQSAANPLAMRNAPRTGSQISKGQRNLGAIEETDTDEMGTLQGRTKYVKVIKSRYWLI